MLLRQTVYILGKIGHLSNFLARHFVAAVATGARQGEDKAQQAADFRAIS